jgi:hypothetical protein
LAFIADTFYQRSSYWTSMPMKYCQVMKNGLAFTPLRAIGLALEVAFSVGISRGFFMVVEEDLKHVEVKGDDLRTRTVGGSIWRACSGSATLMELLPADAAYAHAVYKKLIGFLQQLGLNIFRSDLRIPGGHGSHDLTAAFASLKQCLVNGLLSVELKMRSYHRGYKKILAKLKESCEARLELLKRLSSQRGFKGVLLVVVWSSRVSRGWSPSFLVELLTEIGWQTLKAPPKPKNTLKPLKQIFEEMQWHKAPRTVARVGKVARFLKALNRSRHDVASVAKVWNKTLSGDGSPLRVKKVRLGRAGRSPWVGTKAFFRKVYRFL